MTHTVVAATRQASAQHPPCQNHHGINSTFAPTPTYLSINRRAVSVDLAEACCAVLTCTETGDWHWGAPITKYKAANAVAMPTSYCITNIVLQDVLSVSAGTWSRRLL